MSKVSSSWVKQKIASSVTLKKKPSWSWVRFFPQLEEGRKSEFKTTNSPKPFPNGDWRRNFQGGLLCSLILCHKWVQTMPLPSHFPDYGGWFFPLALYWMRPTSIQRAGSRPLSRRIREIVAFIAYHTRWMHIVLITVKISQKMRNFL